jgi:5'-nucleotidase
MVHARALALVLVVGAGCAGSTSKTLVLLTTTDEHSHVIGFGPEADDFPAATMAGTGAIVGGLGRRSVLLASERARAKALGAAALTVSAGDNMMGTLVQVATTSSAPDYVLMKQLGYDVTTLGNHEFDFGPAALAQAITYAQANGGMIPTVSSNIHFDPNDPGDDTLAALFDDGTPQPLIALAKPLHRSLIVKTSNGLRVGFVGLVGADAASKAKGKAPVTFSIDPTAAKGEDDLAASLAQIYVDLQPVVDRLRKSGVDLVVALSHSGVDDDDPTKGEDYQIAQNVSGIDVIVSGHSHLVANAMPVANLATGKTTLVQQAGKFGEKLGRITIKVQDGKVSIDMADTAILDVDDHTVSDPTYNPAISAIVSGVEQNKLMGGQSFLERTLTQIEGAPVMDDPTMVGDLYFRLIGKSAFDVVGIRLHAEAPLVDLSSDATLAAAEEYGGKTFCSLQASGSVRADLQKGRTGELRFADVFRVLPLGFSPVELTIGSPLTRVGLLMGELKAALELTAGYSYHSKNAADLFLVAGGLKFEYDTSRPEFDPHGNPLDFRNGRITKMTIASDHSRPDVYDKVVFDINAGGYAGAVTDPVVVATNLYVTEFAAVAGVTVKDPVTLQTVMPVATIFHRPDGSEIKDWEALAEYVKKQSAQNGGTLPARYSPSFTPRAICTGPLCVQ